MTATEKLLFNTGQVVMTASIDEAIRSDMSGNVFKSVLSSLGRHIRGDWGDLGAEDKQMNESALKLNNRLFSKYTNIPAIGDIYIITECDRSCTTILRPDEY